MKHLQLPEDIWRCIAAFLPQEHLVTLISVNRPLYNIILDARYRDIHWDKLDWRTLKSLERLKTPLIAARVRRLHVRAWFIEYISQRYGQDNPSFWSKLARDVKLLRRKSSSAIHTAHARDILASMTEAVRLMINVTEYEFEWRDLPPTPKTMRFQTAARMAFGVSLRKLTLYAQLDNFNSLLSTVDFDNLEELELFFDYEPTYAGNSDLLRNSIAPFINHFRRSLGSLTISSASQADLSALFLALEPFPRLHKFVARLAFDTEHLSDPRGVVNILRTNADTLSQVEIVRSSSAEESVWAPLSVALATNESSLMNLEFLKIPTLTSVDDTFDATLAYVGRSADNLTHLCLTDHFMREPEFAALMQLFAHRPLDAGLQALHIGLGYMSAEVLDLLARRAPCLEKLFLVFPRDVIGSIAHHSTPWYPGLFYRDLANRSYTDWALQNIGIWQNRFIETPNSISSSEEINLMEHFSYCIPSIKKFKGEQVIMARTSCRECGPRSSPLRS